MKIQSLIFAILALGTVHAWASSPDCTEDSRYPEISKSELKKVVQAKSGFIVDVNGADSFKAEHVPGAIHYGDHRKDFASLLPKDKNALVVAYCGGPKCSAWKQAAEEACKLGYTNVKHFKEGISGWTAKN